MILFIISFPLLLFGLY